MLDLARRAQPEPLLKGVPSDEAATALRALGEVNRLRLYALLTMGPMAVGDLVTVLGLSQALVSHHLAVLKAAGLVVDRRDDGDARQIIYSVNKPVLRALYGELTLLLDPIKTVDTRPTNTPRRVPMTGPIRVLFLCTGNSARSQMAEALLRAQGEGLFETFSAGTHPKGINPLTVKAMEEVGIDVSDHTSKSLDIYLDDEFDYIITVCDSANEACPTFPGDYQRIHWSFDDPAAAQGSEDERLNVFRRVRQEIRQRVSLFVNAHRREAAQRITASV
jgi:thioredoxin type arsenate reductase